MRKYKKLFHSNGLTLIEVLASIVILGIVLTAFFSFFSQSMMLSTKAEDRLTAINYSEKVLYDYKKYLKSNYSVLDNNGKQTWNVNSLEEYIGQESKSKDDHQKNTFEINHKLYKYEIFYYHEESVGQEEEIGLYRLQVKIYDEAGNEITSIYDYLNIL